MLVITPLGIEMKFLVAALTDQGFLVYQKTAGAIEVYTIDKLNLTLARGGHGKVACALKAQQAIHQLGKVEAVLCVGAAGRLAGQLQVADVVIAELVLEHDYHERFSQTPQPRFTSDPHLIADFRKAAASRTFVHFGMMASGDEDIVDEARSRDLFERTSALAVAWEGAGVARAAQLHGIPFCEVRGITDGADENAMAHFQDNIKLVMRNIADLLIEVRRQN